MNTPMVSTPCVQKTGTKKSRIRRSKKSRIGRRCVEGLLQTRQIGVPGQSSNNGGRASVRAHAGRRGSGYQIAALLRQRGCKVPQVERHDFVGVGKSEVPVSVVGQFESGGDRRCSCRAEALAAEFA